MTTQNSTGPSSQHTDAAAPSVRVSVAVNRGLRFAHKRWVAADNAPLECVVTRVALGVVYYRAADGGTSYYLPLEQFRRDYGSQP